MVPVLVCTGTSVNINHFFEGWRCFRKGLGFFREGLGLFPWC